MKNHPSLVDARIINSFRNPMIFLASTTISFLAAMDPGFAAEPASDNASQSAYSGGWTNGSNGGTGFQPWSLNPTSSGSGQGFYIGDSTANGGGHSPYGINVNGDAFGFYCNNGNTTTAERKFTDPGLIIDQQIRLEFENGWIDSGGPSVGVGLQGTDDTPRVEFYFSGGDTQYRINDSRGLGQATGIGWTDEGFSLVFELTGTNLYSLTVTAINSNNPSGGPWTFTGTLTGLSNAPIDRIRAWNYNAGSGTAYDAFINSLSVSCNNQPTTTAGSDSPQCVGSTLELTATGNASDTYSWSGPNAFTSTNQNPTIANVTTNASGTYSVVRTELGCASPTSTVSVTINPIPSVTASNGGLVCVGSTLYLYGNGPTNGTYNWTGPNLFTSTSQNPTIANAQTNDSGTYNVWVTVNGCASAQSSTSATVVNPNVLASSTSPQCSGNTLQLSATGYAGDTFSWSGPNSFTSTSQNPTIANVTTAASGTYTVIRTSATCGNNSTSTVSVTINATPITSASNNGPVCLGQTLTLSATGNAGDAYSWTGPDGFSSTSQNPTISNVTAAAAGTYSVTRTENGCTSATSNTTVTVNSPAPCSISGASEVPSFTDDLTYTGPSGSGLTYSWTISGNGTLVGSSTTETATITSTAPGTYVLNLSVGGVAGCNNSSCSETVTVAACLISGPTSVQALTGGYVYYAPDAGSDYNWTVCGAAAFATFASNAVGLSTAESGSFTLTATYFDAFGSNQSCSLTASIPSNSVNVLTQHNNISRTGANLQEILLTPANVNTNQFGQLFTLSVDGEVYAQPLYVNNLTTSNGVMNVVYVCTEHGSVYAFNADTASNALWSVNLAASVPISAINNCSDLVPEIGITSTPVINLSNNTIYVEDKTMTTTGGTNSFYHYLHALDIVTGAEKFGGPVLINGSVSNATFNAQHTLQRPGLLLLSDVVYLAFGSHCDWEPYNGWLMGYNATNVQQQTTIFCVTPDDSSGEGGIWNCGQGPAADSNGNIYVMSGNGDFNANTGGPDYGDSFIKLSTSGGTLSVVDYFTPWNQGTLDANDTDVGSGGPVLIPGTSLVVGIGKPGLFWLVNANNMGHYVSGPSDTNIVQEFQATPAAGTMGPDPVYWQNGNGQYLYLSCAHGPTQVYGFNGSTIITNPVAVGPTNQTRAGGMALSANGTTNGILWVIDSVSNGTVRAYDAANMPTELWDSEQNASRDSMGSYTKFSSPTIANGKVYVPSSNAQVVVYGLLNPNLGNPTPSAVIATPTSVCQNTTNTASVPNAGTAVYTWSISGSASIISGQNTPAITYSVSSSSPIAISVAVSNSCNAVSSNATVTVQTAPSITVEPSRSIATNHVGQSITNSVTATGSDLAYQWYKTAWATNGWSFSTTTNDPDQNGFFIGSSANNGDPPHGNIDSDGVSWGLYANNANLSSAIRPLYGAMATGQTFQIDMDNGYITGGSDPGSVGFGLMTSVYSNRFEFYFQGGNDDYFIHDSRGLGQDTGIPWTDNPLYIAFTQTGTDAYSVTIITGTSTNTITGTMAGPSGSTIANLRLFNYNAGAGSSYDAFFNNLSFLNTTDNAANSAYANGWLSGTDGGTLTIAAGTNATYVIPSASLNDAGVFWAGVSGLPCPSVTSSSIVQTVISP